MAKPPAVRAEEKAWIVLSVLAGEVTVAESDRLVGKLDAAADRKAGILRVNAIHEDEPFSSATPSAVDAEIENLAK